jgi:hypothetical protein
LFFICFSSSLQFGSLTASGEFVDGSLTGLVELSGRLDDAAASSSSVNNNSNNDLYLGEAIDGVPHGHGELRRHGALAHVGAFRDGLADGFGIESCRREDDSGEEFTRKAFFRRGLPDGVGADVLDERDGTESVLRVAAFVDGVVDREIVDQREAELVLARLFHAEQQMFAASNALSLRWAAVSKQLDSIQSAIADLLRTRRRSASRPTLDLPAVPPSAMHTAANSPVTSPRRKPIADSGQLTASSQAIRAMADQVLAATPPASPQIGAGARADFRTARAEELDEAAGSPTGGERRKLRGAKMPSYSAVTDGAADVPSSPTRARPTARTSSGASRSTSALPTVPMAKLALPAPSFDDSVLTPRRFATLMPASVVTVQLARERVWPGETLTGAVHVEIPKGAVLEECKIAFVARTEAVDGSGARTGGSQRVFRVRKVLVAQEKPLRHGLHSLAFSFTTRSDTPPSGASATMMRAQTLRASATKSGASDSAAPLRLTRDNVSRSLRRAQVSVAAATQTMAYSLEVTLKFGKRPVVLYRHRVVIAERSLEPAALESFNAASLNQLLATLDADMERECQAVTQRYEAQVNLLLEAMMVHEVMLLSQPFTFAMALAQRELANRLKAAV